jgi:hypothetical protein
LPSPKWSGEVQERKILRNMSWFKGINLKSLRSEFLSEGTLVSSHVASGRSTGFPVAVLHHRLLFTGSSQSHAGKKGIDLANRSGF